jgi:hypothetical protein
MPSDQSLLRISLTVLAAAIAVAVRSARYRWIAVNVAATALAVPLFQVFQHERLRVREHLDPLVWSQLHDELGTIASPNLSLHWRKTVGFTRVFDITATTNAAGFRVTPPAPKASASVVFMGCSYTFGHGVGDRETYPYLVGEALGPRVAAYNISFNGWGPHELLAALQSGLVTSLVKEPPELVMVLTITDHVRRVVGRQVEEWYGRSPRYVLEDGVAVRRGRFGDDPSRPRYSYGDEGFWSSFSSGDFALYGAVMKAIRDEVARRFPTSRFEVVLWDSDHAPMREQVVDALRAADIEPHLSDEFLPDRPGEVAPYMISKHELHPGAEGLRLLAGFVERRLIGAR